METPKKKSTERFIKYIRKHTREIFTSEQKILIVMEGLLAETSVAELCRKHSIVQYQQNRGQDIILFNKYAMLGTI